MQKGYAVRRQFTINGVAFAGEGKLVSKRQLAMISKKLKPRYPTSGLRVARAELPAAIGGDSVAHRFLRRGEDIDLGWV